MVRNNVFTFSGEFRMSSCDLIDILLLICALVRSNVNLVTAQLL